MFPAVIMLKIQSPCHKQSIYTSTPRKIYLPYLLKLTPQLQLFSGLEKCGVYSRAATIRGCVYAHGRSVLFLTALFMGTMSSRQCGLRFQGRFRLPGTAQAVAILSHLHRVLEGAAVVTAPLQYYECH